MTLPLLDAPATCRECGAERPQPLHVHGDGLLLGCRACAAVWWHPAPPDDALATLAGDTPDRARERLRAWAAARREELEAAPAPRAPRGLARLSRRRRTAHQERVHARKRAQREPLDLPLLDPAEGCPCCAAPALKPLHLLRNPRRRIAPVAHLVLTGCPTCGIVFSHPLPTPEQADAYYAGEGEGWEERLDEHEDEQAEFMERKHERYRHELGLLGDALGGPGRVLDFGCGLGAWLDVLAEAGWETEGLEPGAEQRAATAQRHTVIDAVAPGPRYDLVVLNHVLEHLPDPVATLRELRAAARPGARLYASSPNLGRLPEHGKLSYVASGVHVMSYTADGLRNVLGLAGWAGAEELTGAEWDALDARPGMRVRMVAVAGDPVAPAGEPLAAAEAALRARAARAPRA